MAFKVSVDVDAKGDRRLLQRDKKTGKPVYLYLQIVPDEFIRALRKEHARGVRADKVGKMPSGELLERSIEARRAYAAKAIVGPHGSEGFDIELATQQTADVFAKALGVDSLRGGDVVSIDGKWTDEVKDLVLRVIPGLDSKVATIESEMRGFDAEVEEEAGESFR